MNRFATPSLLTMSQNEQLSCNLAPKCDKLYIDGTDDDIPPPLPTTSPPKLSPESTLTLKYKERVPLNLGKYVFINKTYLHY